MKLGKKHKTAIKLLIEGELSKEEIAQSVKVSRKTLYNWLNDADFSEEYNEQVAEIDRKVKRRISNMVNDALDRQKRILNKSKNDNAAAVVAKDVLDRAGYAPDSKIQLEGEGAVQIINNIPRSDNSVGKS